jgi:antitoxin (DNA-binding transcriptional repressor) of toxin-antitoxin stability system
LSSYLRLAAEGEHITVTDRGRPIAMLTPLVGGVDLDAAARAGWVTRASERGLRPTARHPAARRVAEVLSEDREG